MLRTVDVFTLPKIGSIGLGYKAAFENHRSTILVEYTDKYRNARGQNQ